MNNPFVYGEAVSGHYFTGREKECRELRAEHKNGQNIIIFSPRRYGKTSLIKKVLEGLSKEGVLTFYIDLFFVNSKQKFIETYAEAVAQELKGPFAKISQTLKELIPKIIPKIVIKTGGGTSFEFDFDRTRKISPILEDLYESVHKLIKHQKKKAVVVFDEFQELLSFDDGEIEAGMRSKFQFHRNVSYVLLGSKRNLMQKLFDDKSRPFYNSGRKYPLKKIEAEEFAKFIKLRFGQTRIKISDEQVISLLELTGRHPYYTQELCHFVWENAREDKKVTAATINKSIREILSSESTNYNNIWDGITAKQKGFLIALAKNPEANVYSQEFILGNQLGTPSTIQRLVKLLYDKQIIEKENGKVFFEDIFFEKWIISK